jgi:hypothetical protein
MKVACIITYILCILTCIVCIASLVYILWEINLYEILIGKLNNLVPFYK